jgi:hypothetical protein
MKCPHCNKLLPFISCSECGEEIPEKSQYCCWCGKPTKVKVEEEGDEFFKRILCSDGNCIGVINEKGVCNICRKPYAGKPI